VTITAVFLDDGGVMNDNTRRAAEWQRLVGEFLAPRLGGSADAWGAANLIVFERQWERFLAWEHHGLEHNEYGDFLGSPEERERWLGEMCDHVGMARPPRDSCLELARETEAYVISRVRAAYPGAVDAIRALHARGYRLGTASGTTSNQLEANLTGMGVRELFASRLYGPDLVQTRKGRPDFHPRIFADAGVDPAEALVVDDAPEILGQAAQAGVRTVLVTTRGPAVDGPWAAIDSLAELPALLD
jgi:HAD superfamily hydrolase (TIGR01509 family)